MCTTRQYLMLSVITLIMMVTSWNDKGLWNKKETHHRSLLIALDLGQHFTAVRFRGIWFNNLYYLVCAGIIFKMGELLICDVNLCDEWRCIAPCWIVWIINKNCLIANINNIHFYYLKFHNSDFWADFYYLKLSISISWNFQTLSAAITKKKQEYDHKWKSINQ